VECDLKGHDVDGFIMVRRGARTLYIDETLAVGDGTSGVQAKVVDAIVRMSSATQLSHAGGWRGRSGRLSVVRARLGDRCVVVRRFTHGGLLGGILPEVMLGQKRVLREIEIVRHARQNNVPVPRVMAAMVVRKLGLWYRAYMVTEEIEGASNLTELAIRLMGMDEDLGTVCKRAALEAIAKAIAQMHKAGIIHGDLHLRNVLVRLPATGLVRRPKAEAFILDFDRARRVTVVSHDQRLANLARLMRSVFKVQPAREQLTTRDGVRFLRAYLGACDHAEMRRWMRILSRAPRLHQASWAVTGDAKRSLVSSLATEGGANGRD
jgi:tRNA A-37 threonylcarbamoyl transferase component Bud32